MKRAGKIALAAAGLLVGLPLLGIVTIMVAANIGPGRHLIERLTYSFSDGTVTIGGLEGRFPDALRIRHLAVSDKDGVWLAIDQGRLDWSPLSLLFGELHIGRLAAAHIALTRLPQRTAGSSAGSGSVDLPVSVAVDDFRIDRLDLAPAIAGAAASVGVKGDLHLASLDNGSAVLDARRIDRAGRYGLSVTLAPGGPAARIDVAEPSQGLLSGILGLPDLGPLSIAASLDGPRNAERTRLSLSAGPLTAQGQGTIDLRAQTLIADLTAAAPAMTPRADLGWQSVRLEAHLDGPFTSPNATGHLDIKGLRAAGGGVEQVKADIQGDSGTVGLTASLDGLRIPGPRPDLFAAAPFVVHANVRLNTPQRPVMFTLSHPLVTASGEADTGGAPANSVTVTLPSLAPFAAIADVDVQGQAALTAKLARRGERTRFDVDGTIGVTGGLPAVRALIGDKATLAITGSLRREEVALDKFALDGKTLNVSATGGQKDGVVDLDWKVALSDLSSLASTLAGTLSAEGHVHGPRQNLSVTAQAAGDVAAAGLSREPLTLSLQAQGLPASPSVNLAVQGRLAGAPLQLAAAVNRQSDGTLDVSLDRLEWKSAAGQGELTLAPGAVVPLGQMRLRLARLDDLAPLTGLTAAGSIDATFDTVQVEGKPQVSLRAEMEHLALGGASVDRLAVEARVTDPATDPKVSLVASADGVRNGALTGAARLTANGTLESLALRLSSEFQALHGPAKLSAAATARLPQRDLQLSSLQADYDGETARLLAPVRIALAGGVSMDNLRVGIGKAVVALSGRLTPTLAVTLSARDLSPALAKPFVPGFYGTGTIALNGQATGTLAAPAGTLHLTGHGLRAIAGTVGGLPAADIDATATLAHGAARLDARLTAGSAVHLRLAGTAPLQPAAPLDLRLTGTTDLAILDPLLTPNGRTARGKVTLDLAVAGTAAAPRATGSLRLAGGSVQDFAQGIHITDLAGVIQADGNTLRIAQLTGRAGRGTVSVAGTIGLLQPEQPVALTVTARNARPLASDLLSATMNADLTLRGQIQGALSVSGEIHVSRASINIPDGFPQGVAVLNVRPPGVKPAAAAPGQPIALALTIAAPEQVFVRGHGIDAEMGGKLKIGGNATAPAISGGLDLRHGTFSLAGQTLTFTSGKVGFGGGGLAGKLDPAIDFVAQSSSNSVTATLTVTGYADAPKIRLASNPQLPQDEILGQLLFSQSVKQLSPFQLAAIAQAVASLSGAGGTDPLAAVRNSLGLDRLSAGAASSGGGATVEAGKYVANGVFLGARQGTGGGTQAKVQIDLTRHLKLESTLGAGGAPASGATTPDNDPGSSIGLTYQFEY